MKNVLDGHADTTSRERGLAATLFQDYRKHFGLFWRVMLPVIGLSLVFGDSVVLISKLAFPEASWVFSTSEGLSRSSVVGDASDASGTIHSGFRFEQSSVSIGFLWLAMCPLALAIVHLSQGIETTARSIWRQTLRRIGSVVGVFLAPGLIVVIISVLPPILFFLLMEKFSPGGTLIFLVTPLFMIASGGAVYFFVKWSLGNQCLMLENLTVRGALRRSGELVKGRWGRFFAIYLLLALLTVVFTGVCLGLTLLLFSTVSPEFAPMRDVLQSGRFVVLFCGGWVSFAVENAPLWAIGAMVVVKTLLDAVLAPVWALLTTHLYRERIK